MKKLILLLAVLLVIGCTSQEAHLIDLVETTPTPHTSVTPTPPEPEPIPVAPVVGEGFKTDLNGLPILDERTHFFTYYLTVDNLRVYEENGEQLVDAIITNNYQRTLTGGLTLAFRKDGLTYGYAEFYTADGGLKLFPGENRVYADVRAEVDVQMMDFEFEVSTAFEPEQ